MHKEKLLTLTTLGVSLSMLLAGCSAKGPQFSAVETIPKDKALLYVYRPERFAGSAVYYDIHTTRENEEDEIIGTLENGGYVQHFADAGEIEVWAKTESTSSVTLDVDVNETYCVKGGVSFGFLLGRPNLEIVDNTTCMNEINSTHLPDEK